MANKAHLLIAKYNHEGFNIVSGFVNKFDAKEKLEAVNKHMQKRPEMPNVDAFEKADKAWADTSPIAGSDLYADSFEIITVDLL